MSPKRLIATLVGALLLVTATPATAAPPVEITKFTVSPSCARAGGSVTANVTVENNTLWFKDTYAQVKLYELNLLLYTSEVFGPYPVPPFFPISVSQDVDIPSNVPPGLYDVELGIGPSASNPTGWSRRRASLTILPIC